MRRVNVEREICSIELTKTSAEIFKNYLRKHDIYFEASEAGSLIYFSCMMTDEEMNNANTWLEKYLQ